MRPTCATSSSTLRPTRKPGIDSSLSSVPPVCASPRPESLATGMPMAAASGASAIVVLSPTPPVECLSTTVRPSDERSIVAPESTIACVSSLRLGLGEPAEDDRHRTRRSSARARHAPRRSPRRATRSRPARARRRRACARSARPLSQRTSGGARAGRRPSRAPSHAAAVAPDVGELAVVPRRPGHGPARGRAAARTRASDRSTASSGRSRGPRSAAAGRPGRARASRSGIAASISCRQRWKPSGSLRCP